MSEIISYISSGNIPGLLIYLLSTLLAMLIAVSFHEWAHAYVAYKLGDPTAKNMGRMSLDPLKHMDWIGFLFFLLFRIGWAKPVMVNPRNLKNYKRDDILISLAGIAMNLILSFVAYGVLFFCTLFFYNYYLAYVLFDIFLLNVSFAIFNILPIPPLDGFHVVQSLFLRKSYRFVAFLQRYGFLLLVILLVTGYLGVVLSWAVGGLESIYYAFFSLFV